MSEAAFSQPYRPRYIGMVNCKHRTPDYSIEDVVCPCGRIDKVAFIDCAVKGHIKAIACRMYCGDYAPTELTRKDK